MRFSEILKEAIADKHLLLSPFYQAWTKGELELDTLKHYAKEYGHHVRAFPRYVSAAHSMCGDTPEAIEARKLLSENLNDEENNGVDHPELWNRFAEGLGVSREEMLSAEPSEAVKHMMDTFFKASRSSYAEGLASLYSYEYQIPEIACTKIEGLKKHYSITDKRTLSFFSVHQEADKFHRAACEKLLDRLSPEEQEKALDAAKRTASALWDFLGAVYSNENCESCAEATMH